MAQKYDLNLLQDPTGLGEDTLSSELVYTGDYLKV